MKFLLDTCVISELVNKEPNSAVVEWIRSRRPGDLFLSVLTVGELEKGMTKLGRSNRAVALRQWLEVEIAGRFHDRIIPVSAEIARKWGEMCANAELRGKKRPAIDSLIAATAIVNGLTVATRNVDDMAGTGAKIFDPFSGGWYS